MFKNAPKHKATTPLAEKVLDFFNDTYTIIMLELSSFPDTELKYEIDLTPKK